ncbi:MAG: MATE family efflux transporter [Lachnospiraceae bacterium]|nr:MATE family efflux transporter [Lachnospiraceae bacterium]
MENKDNKNVEDLTEGSIWKKVIIFVVPLIASNLLQVAFNLSDVVVVGRFAGGIALGCVGSTSVLVSMFIGLLIGLGSGTLVKVAKSIGMRNEKLIRRSISTSLYLMLFCGIIVGAVGLVFAKSVLLLLGTKPELLSGAELYLKIYLLGMPATAIYNFGNSVYSASGNTKKPLKFLTIAGVVNIILNLVFVIICKMSVAGVALASCIGQYLSAILIIASLCKEEGVIKVNIFNFSLDVEVVKEIFAIGVPAALQNTIFCVANLFVTAGINKLPLVMVQGNSAALNIDPIMYQILDAIYIACATFIGQNYGAGKMDRVWKSFKVTTVYALGVCIFISILLVLYGRQFLSLFTTDPEIVEAGLVRLNIMAYSFPFFFFFDNSVSASRGLGKGTIPTIIIIIGSCVFRVIWIYTVFAYYGTAKSLYLLYICSWIITGAFETLYFVRLYFSKVR